MDLTELSELSLRELTLLALAAKGCIDAYEENGFSPLEEAEKDVQQVKEELSRRRQSDEE